MLTSMKTSSIEAMQRHIALPLPKRVVYEVVYTVWPLSRACLWTCYTNGNAATMSARGARAHI